MIHHDFFNLMIQEIDEIPEIVATPDVASHDSNAGTHDLSINVTPDTIAWTSTENDTGDGVDWFTEPGSGTGDDAIYQVRFTANTGVERNATITISDDAAVADDEVISVTQQAGI